MNLERKYFLHPFNTIRNKFYAELFRSNYYKRLVQKNLKKALNFQYKSAHYENLNWSNPQTLDAKIMWLEAMTDTAIWSKLTDKYEVRKYVSSKGYEENLVKCYGVWDNVNEIDYESFPSKFVIKCTHDSGSTHIVKDKSKADFNEINTALEKKLHTIMGYTTCEPHYFRIKPRIIAEELLEDEENQLSSSIIDYKIWCFNGIPHVALLCYDRYNDANGAGHSTATFDLYNLDPWQPKREFLVKCEPTPNYKFIPKPICLENMLNMAKDLTKGFPVVRADFYIIKDKPYFGELTFTPAGGLNYSYSDLAQTKMGKMIKL